MTEPTTLPGFDDLIGLRLLESTKDSTVCEVEITADHHQPYGILHGGVLCAIVETVGSISGAAWYGGAVVGVNNNTSFLRAVRTGTLTARSAPIHRGRTSQLWEVDITDDQDRLIAKGQLRLANLDPGAELARG